MLLPSSSRRRALARTSNALSVPRCDMRSANLIATERILMNSEQCAAVDAKRLPGDVARLLRTKKGAGRAELGRIAQPTHWRAGGGELDLLVWVLAGGPGDVSCAVREDRVRREAVDRDSVRRQFARQRLCHPPHRPSHVVRQREVRERLADRDRGDEHDPALIGLLYVREPGADQANRAHER